MNACAVLFPGQGSQKADMGLDFIRDFPEYRDRLTMISDHIGADMFEILADQTRLDRTLYAQLAILAVSSMVYDEIIKAGVIVKAVAGFSLGEYTALWASGVYPFAEIIDIVSNRAALMHEAVRNVPGGMMAVIGLSHQTIIDALATINQSAMTVVAANLNAPGQTVISGTMEGLAKAEILLKSIGAKRVLPLNVEGAFHSPLMESAALGLHDVLLTKKPNPPHHLVYMNTTARPLKVEETTILLERHMTEPVRFADMIRNMVGDGIDTFIEAGQGTVLSGLVRRIAPDIEVISIGTVIELIKLKGLITSCV